MSVAAPVIPSPTLRIRPFPVDPAAPQPVGLERWLFLDYGGGWNESLDYRWIVEHRRMPGFEWWGVVAIAPTHVSAMDGIAEEIALAREAIARLQADRQVPTV